MGEALNMQTRLEEVATKCNKCKKCLKNCLFLQQNGTPGDIATKQLADNTSEMLPYQCSLCGLCSVVCPQHLDISAMFLAMRQEAFSARGAHLPEHKTILGYEAKGVSPLFSWYHLPKGAKTVFFPGCTLSGTRSDTVKKLYEALKKEEPDTGIVLDCCTKPSHDLGDIRRFSALFSELKAFFVSNGIKKVVVACPNCYKVFKTYGAPELEVTSVYERLVQMNFKPDKKVTGAVTVHDSCVARHEEQVQQAVRSLIASTGLDISEMKHAGKKTLCCGEGGSVGFIAPELAKAWTEKRKAEAGQRQVMTFCAGCAGFLGRQMPASHVLDLIYAPSAAMNQQVKTTKTPFTYLKRLGLKKTLQKLPSDKVVTRERPAKIEGVAANSGNWLKKAGILGLILAVILIARFSGFSQHLDQEGLRQYVAGFGVLAPLVFVGIYSIAPALMLPGLPFPVAAGVLFGPVWGTVYSILGATIGATVAFLISRYAGRDWIETKLKGTRLKELDAKVMQHGWKVVAFTRLVPVFPFNLLNYAFGLTKIGVLEYIIASLVFMLPGCMAYVVFSSSLLDILKGRLSWEFGAGLGLFVVVSIVVMLAKRLFNRKIV